MDFCVLYYFKFISVLHIHREWNLFQICNASLACTLEILRVHTDLKFNFDLNTPAEQWKKKHRFHSPGSPLTKSGREFEHQGNACSTDIKTRRSATLCFERDASADLRQGFSRLVCTQKKDNGTVIVSCELGNPMQPKQKVQAGLYFTVGNLEEVDSQVLFRIQIKSKNSINPNSNSVDLPLKVSAVATLEMRGGSSPVECVLPIANWKPVPHPQSLEEIGPLVEHVYELRNLGPATVNARVQVEFPTHLHEKWLLYVFANASEESITCHTDSRDIDLYKLVKEDPSNTTARPVHRLDKREAEQPESQHKETVHVNCSSGDVCLRFVCEAVGLERGGSAVVKVMSRLWVQTFLERPYEDFVLHSKAFYELLSMPSKIQSEVHLSGHSETHTKVVWKSPDGEKQVPVWWIVVAVIAGLFLLALINFILWKVGFFKRARPPSDGDDTQEPNTEQNEYAIPKPVPES